MQSYLKVKQENKRAPGKGRFDFVTKLHVQQDELKTPIAPKRTDSSRIYFAAARTECDVQYFSRQNSCLQILIGSWQLHFMPQSSLMSWKFSTAHVLRLKELHLQISNVLQQLALAHAHGSVQSNHLQNSLQNQGYINKHQSPLDSWWHIHLF